jgi:hypothetical protein
MAKVLESGRYVSQAAIEKRQKLLAVALALTAALFGFLGFLSGQVLRTSPWWAIALCACGFVTLLRVVFVMLRRRIEGLEAVLIDALSTPFGELEHVVLGQTGVFVLNTKNWKGEVSANGHGELLWNGHQIDSPLIEDFSKKVSQIDETLKTLTGGLAVCIRPVLVFTSARVEANWGTTGDVQCLPADQLRNYISDASKGKKLEAEEIKSLGKAFLAMTRMTSGETGTQHLNDRASAGSL